MRYRSCIIPHLHFPPLLCTPTFSIPSFSAPPWRHHDVVGAGRAECSTTKHIGDEEKWQAELTRCTTMQYFDSELLLYPLCSPTPVKTNKCIGNMAAGCRRCSLWYCISNGTKCYYLAPNRDSKYCNQRVCMSVCPQAYLKNHMSKLHARNFLRILPVAVARSSSDRRQCNIGGVFYRVRAIWPI